MENKVLKKFLKYLSQIQGCSLKTVNAYENDLLLFFSFIINDLNLKISIEDINIFILQKVTEKTIYSFLIYLNYYRNNTASTRKRKLATIKSFYKYLYLYYPCFNNKCNPAANINTQLLVERVPKYLNLEQASKIQNVFNHENSKNYIRNNTIITMFLHTGMRISELVNLNILDINFSKSTINFTAKGNYLRTMYLNEYTLNKIKEYLNTRNDRCKALFISSKGIRISTQAVNDICKKAFTLIGIDDNYHYSAHTLRHTAGTIIYKTTKDLLITQNFLGHKSIASTEIYTHICNEDVRNAVEKNPLNELFQ